MGPDDEFARALYDIWLTFLIRDKRWVSENIEVLVHMIDKNILFHIAALISCGLRISAYEWSMQNMIPVLIHNGNEVFPCNDVKFHCRQ